MRVCNINLFGSYFPILLAYDSIFLDLPNHMLKSSFTVFRSQYRMKWESLSENHYKCQDSDSIPLNWLQDTSMCGDFCDCTGCPLTKPALHLLSFPLFSKFKSSWVLFFFPFQMFHVLVTLCLKKCRSLHTLFSWDPKEFENSYICLLCHLYLKLWCLHV